MAKKVYEEENIRAIADKIREKTGGDSTYKVAQMPKGIEEVYEAGKSQGGGVGQNPLEYAQIVSETYKGVAFPDGYELTLNLPNVTSLNSAFYNATGIKKIILKGNEKGNSVNFRQAFRGCSAETIDLTKFTAKFSSINLAFYFNTKIVEILGEIDLTECTDTTSAFASTSNLVTITPKANTIKISISFAQSSKLSTASVQSIIDGLATLVTNFPEAQINCPIVDAGDKDNYYEWWEITSIRESDYGVLVTLDGAYTYPILSLTGVNATTLDEVPEYFKNAKYYQLHSMEKGFSVWTGETETLTLPKTFTNPDITEEQVTTEIAKAIEKGWTVVQ